MPAPATTLLIFPKKLLRADENRTLLPPPHLKSLSFASDAELASIPYPACGRAHACPSERVGRHWSELLPIQIAGQPSAFSLQGRRLRRPLRAAREMFADWSPVFRPARTPPCGRNEAGEGAPRACEAAFSAGYARIKVTLFMAPHTFEQLLDRAASSRGIEPGFWDIWGRYHTTAPEAKQAILRAMGFAADTPEELTRSLAAETRREWGRLLPPAIVAGESDAVELALNVPAESLGERARISILREDGGAADFDLQLWDLPQDGSAEMDGQTWVRKKARLPVRLPLGYHEIYAKVGSASATARYIVTPERAWTDPHLGRGGRAAGIAISLYGVRSERNWGCGDFRDLLDVVDWAADEMDASFIGLNPLHAIHNRRPFNTSPYLPNCIFYQNFLYLDVEGMEDFARCRRAHHTHRCGPAFRPADAFHGWTAHRADGRRPVLPARRQARCPGAAAHRRRPARRHGGRRRGIGVRRPAAVRHVGGRGNSRRRSALGGAPAALAAVGAAWQGRSSLPCCRLRLARHRPVAVRRRARCGPLPDRCAAHHYGRRPLHAHAQ